MGGNLADLFEAVSDEVPGADAVVVDGDRWTFAELDERSARLATVLMDRNVGPGDRVGVLLGNTVELWESMLAIMKLGAVIMPTATAAGRADLTDRVTRGGARHVLCAAGDTLPARREHC